MDNMLTVTIQVCVGVCIVAMTAFLLAGFYTVTANLL